jgi:YHS domain-containing protein
MTTGSILWFLAIGALFYFMMKKGGGCCGGHDHGGHGEQHGHDGAGQGSNEEHAAHHDMQKLEEEDRNEANVLKDPVCGMEVKGNSAALTSKHLGRTFHFCSEQCRNLFDLSPDKYV